MNGTPEDHAAFVEQKKAAALEQRAPVKRQRAADDATGERNWKRAIINLPGKGNRLNKMQDFVGCLPKLAREIEDITRVISQDDAPEFDSAELWVTLQSCVLKADFEAIRSASAGLIEAIRRKGGRRPASPTISPAPTAKAESEDDAVIDAPSKPDAAGEAAAT